MPEHVHLVLHPPDHIRLGPTIGELKARSASRILTGKLVRLPEDCTRVKDGRCRQCFWQPRCYDHDCRTLETVVEKINDCHNDPVKRGLVSEPGAWEWSSYNWYAGEKDVPLAMDELWEIVGE